MLTVVANVPHPGQAFTNTTSTVGKPDKKDAFLTFILPTNIDQSKYRWTVEGTTNFKDWYPLDLVVSNGAAERPRLYVQEAYRLHGVLQ